MNQFSNRTGLVAGAVLAVAAGFVISQVVNASDVSRAADVAVSCGASHRAVVRQTMGQSGPNVDISCVPGMSDEASYVVGSDGRVIPTPVAYGGQRVGSPAAIPAVYYQPPASAMAQPVAARASRPAATPARARKASTWPKRALIIGGSAGAGAGVGALVGGKKGALIGAAVGGGGAALVDALKRN